MSEHLDLVDYRRRVFALYDAMRNDTRADALRLVSFRARKDRLFADHPQSPIPTAGRRDFRGLAYWRHDPALRLVGELETDPDAPRLDVPRSGEGPRMPFVRIGSVRFDLVGTARSLGVYWLDEYAGGIFIPFRDATAGRTTYGGGRYLWDSAKGADLGSWGTSLVIDFNYAYHPSCVYDPRWSCPLAPQENRIDVPIEAGERLVAEDAP